MSIVRKPGSTSPTRHNSTDVTPTRKRSSSTSFGDGIPEKIFHADKLPAGTDAVLPLDPTPSVVTTNVLPPAQISPLQPTAKTLEHYSLRAPANLPAANDQGLRVFKSRMYVDIAPGEIVLVRETGIVGEYRAALASESAALGPALFFDPRSKRWALERPQPLSGPVKVVDIEIDKLMHDVKKDYAQKNRVHTGNGDSFEYTAAQDGKLVARGLKQFPLEQAAIIRSELKAVEGIFSDASHAIDQKYPGADAVYQGFFGAEHLSVAQRFSDSFARGQALAREYQGVWGDEKILGVDAHNNSAAWMYKRDFHGRLFINRNYMQRGVLSLSLGHEMLHTNRVDRFQAVGPNAADYFYLDGRLGRLLAWEALNIYDVPERGISEAIMRGGLTVKYLKAFSEDHEAFLLGVSDYLGLGDDLQLQAAVDLFNADPSMRAQMAANNADSLIFAAKSLQTLHRSELD